MPRFLQAILAVVGALVLLFGIGAANYFATSLFSRDKGVSTPNASRVFDEIASEFAFEEKLRTKFSLSDTEARDVIRQAKSKQKSIVKRATDRAYAANKDYAWGVLQVLSEMRNHESRLEKASPPNSIFNRQRARQYLIFEVWAPIGFADLAVE